MHHLEYLFLFQMPAENKICLRVVAANNKSEGNVRKYYSDIMLYHRHVLFAQCVSPNSTHIDILSLKCILKHGIISLFT